MTYRAVDRHNMMERTGFRVEELKFRTFIFQVLDLMCIMYWINRLLSSAYSVDSYKHCCSSYKQDTADTAECALVQLSSAISLARTASLDDNPCRIIQTIFISYLHDFFMLESTDGDNNRTMHIILVLLCMCNNS